MDIITVYFFYGLSFFSMGLAVLLEVGRSSELDFGRALRSMAGFGLIHGGHEWVEMFLLIHPNIQDTSFYQIIGLGRVVLLAVSFLFLIAFGARLIAGPDRTRLSWQMIAVITEIWIVGLAWLFLVEPSDSRLVALDVYTRYSLAIPGAALAAWGLILQRQKFLQVGMKGYGRAVIAAAIAFGLYGGIGQLFVSPSNVFPSSFLNMNVFLDWFGFPIQLFRSIMACIAAIGIISSLRAFEEETRRHIETLNSAQLAERERLEELRAELLHRTVRAQELERQRIAQELHDELGQTLTALGMGLSAISGNASKPQKVSEQARQLQGVVNEGISGLQNLVGGLYPPQLDDFGLLPTLRWYVDEVKERFGLAVTVSSRGEEADLPIDVRTVLFRLVQESLTNIIRHAKTDRADVLVAFDEKEVRIRVEDSGCGFDVNTTLHNAAHPCWGLLGMIERAALLGGDCQFISEIGVGTIVEVLVPLKERKDGENSSSIGG
ncbi:MAG TPA: sensor histidine kinase [Anaerolineales bacterium]|nr:sensor histidine kinase [Anaerolineales bacterium]